MVLSWPALLLDQSVRAKAEVRQVYPDLTPAHSSCALGDLAASFAELFLNGYQLLTAWLEWPFGYPANCQVGHMVLRFLTPGLKNTGP